MKTANPNRGLASNCEFWAFLPTDEKTLHGNGVLTKLVKEANVAAEVTRTDREFRVLVSINLYSVSAKQKNKKRELEKEKKQKSQSVKSFKQDKEPKTEVLV